MKPETHDAIPERRAYDRRKAVNGRWTYERWVLTFGFTGTILGMTFGLGVNWAKVTTVQAAVAANSAIMVRQDVYRAEQKRFAESLDRQAESIVRLSQAVELLEERLRETHRTPAFGRQ